MDLIKRFDTARDRVSALYAAYLFGLRGAFYQLTFSGSAISPKSVAQFGATVDQLAEVLGSEISSQAHEMAYAAYVDGIKQASKTSDELIGEADSLSRELRAAFLTTLTSQIAADKLTALNDARRIYLGEPGAGSQAPFHIVGDPTYLRFGYVDAQGKTWAPDRHIATSFRAMLVGIRNEALFTASGREQFVLRHAEGKEGVDGLVFARESTDVLPGFDKVMPLLHPNTKALAFEVQT
tara:strand:- start:552 stop:1265 length:714 start_codon:yes stop_codon:yes gene_type:complete